MKTLPDFEAFARSVNRRLLKPGSISLLVGCTLICSSCTSTSIQTSRQEHDEIPDASLGSSQDRPLREITVTDSSKLSMLAWYSSLIEKDAAIRSTFVRLAGLAEKSAHPTQPGKPAFVQLETSGETSGRENYEDFAVFLVVHPILQSRPRHSDEQVDRVVSAIRVVDSFREDANGNRQHLRKSYQFLGFKTLALKPASTG